METTKCACCGVRDALATPVATEAGDLIVTVCPHCDRVQCLECGEIDMSGRARRCRRCSAELGASQ